MSISSPHIRLVQSQRGVGMMEVLVGIILFSIGLSLVMRVLPSANYVTTRSRNITIATNLAQQKVEDLMSIPYSSADLNAGNHTDANNPIENTFSRSWTVVTDDPVAGMKRVGVTVSFETGSSDSTVTLQAYITSRR